MGPFTRDLRYALRMLRKSPGFAAAAALTLALGIGANSAIFSVINVVLLRPLPYPGAARMVMLWESRSVDPNRFPDPKSAQRLRNWIPTNTTFDRWNQRSRSFEAMAGFRWQTLSLVGSGDPERLEGAAVTPGFFSLFGVRPLWGRTFLPEEDQLGNSQVAMLSHRLWMRRFGGSPAIVGGKIILEGSPHTVIGILPALSLIHI